MRSSRLAVGALGAVLVLGLAAGCGGGGGGSGATTASGPTAQQQIRQAFTSFFSGKTSAAQKQKLLQNGQRFAPLLKAAAASPLASRSSAKVSSVTLQGPAKAKVVYTILLGGKPALKSRTGVAVKENGVWKVGDQSFCTLLGLQGATPAVCTS